MQRTHCCTYITFYLNRYSRRDAADTREGVRNDQIIGQVIQAIQIIDQIIDQAIQVTQASQIAQNRCIYQLPQFGTSALLANQ